VLSDGFFEQAHRFIPALVMVEQFSGVLGKLSLSGIDIQNRDVMR
jgi:hypothetical protein